MIEISLIRELVDYDPDTGIFRWKYRDRRYCASDGSHKGWNKKYAGKTCFNTVNAEEYHIGCIFGQNYYAHRVAWAYVTGQWPNGEIDHDNGIRSDNRFVNLYDGTRQINGLNQGMKSTNTSGVTGVRFHKAQKRWVASIRFESILYNLGSYRNFDDAVEARLEAEHNFGFHAKHGKRPSVPDLKAIRRAR